MRHTFSRHLAENGLPIDSLAKLLGHNDLQTTQRYTDVGDPTVRDDFSEAMKHLETTFIRDQKPPALPKNLPNKQ